MRLETTDSTAAEDSQSSTPTAFGIEAYNFPAGASPAIAMTPADTNQNKTPTITDDIRNRPNGFDLSPFIPNWQIIDLLEQKGLPGV